MKNPTPSPSPLDRYENTGRMRTAFCEYFERGRSRRGVLCDVKHRDGTWTNRVWVSHKTWGEHGGTSPPISDRGV